MGTGIETLLIAAAGAGAAAAAAPKGGPKINIPAPEKPPQATKTANRDAAVAGNTPLPGSSMSGNAGTFLTGPGGINPGSLNLGRNKLLGE